jgi:hypothetical protein
MINYGTVFMAVCYILYVAWRHSVDVAAKTERNEQGKKIVAIEQALSECPFIISYKKHDGTN